LLVVVRDFKKIYVGLRFERNRAMDVSVIIVNYNVKALLEQTLLSVYKAVQHLRVELIVVDNMSADESCEMVREKFPEVILVENKENLGFSKANNQGIRMAKGRYVLLLNPDTVISEDTLVKTVDFLDRTPMAGALGVKMIDGRGDFLPESKRGLPTPAVAFYKMSGLAKLFPKSRTFGAYHLSYLDKDKNHKVDVLSGAFMMIRREVLDKTGLLDESFFMYGEDIDLSYRITKAGYENHYFSETTIIHYKGESTKKHSINYVKIFYLAMAKFAKKHFSKQQGWWFTLCINIAIYARAAMALLVRVFNALKLFFIDFTMIMIGYYGLIRYWEIYNKFVVGGFYPDEYFMYHVPAYTLLWLGGIWISGGYQQPFKLSKSVRGIVIGSLSLLAIYALLPESMRFSRALILLGSVWALLITVFLRLVLHFIRYRHLDTSASQISQVLVVGSLEECSRVRNILLNYPLRFKLLGFIKPSDNNSKGEWMGSSENLPLLIEIYKANEIIFCARDISSTEIMELMGKANFSRVKYKIMPEKGAYIIGSNSKNTTGEFYSVDITPALSNQQIRNKKRMLDLVLCFVFIPLLPFMLFRPKFLKQVAGGWMDCLSGRKTWVGYNTNVDCRSLPGIQPSVFFIDQHIHSKIKDEQLIYNLNFIYATNYQWQNDINIIVKAFFSNNFAS
jgi:GT2 family glycosyltransferase